MMENPSLAFTLADSVVATNSGDVRTLAARIKRAIRRRIGGGVQQLEVDVRNNQVVLSGRCSSFYFKQLAQHAAMLMVGGDSLANEIEVTDQPQS
jgi:osmotically-inducible protein OsmY